MMSSRLVGFRVLMMAAVLFWCAVGNACPTCRYAVAERTAQSGIIQGYFWSILFMMSMPFLIFGGLSAYFYYQIRQARGSRHVMSGVAVERDPSAIP